MLTQNNNNKMQQTRVYDNNLISWYMYINDGLIIPLSWQKPLFKILHYALAGKVSKILISAPPQHGKTMLTINAFASMYMINNPDDKVIVTAYSQQRATKYGLTLRNIINRYGKNTLFSPRLSQDQQSKTNFMFDYPHKGELLATGAHGAIMGNPANLIIIDDPIKELKEATSKLMQENLDDWYAGSINTRLRKNDVQRPPILIVVAQRLNENDLQGILQQKYDVIHNNDVLTKLANGETITPDTVANLNFPALSLGEDKDILRRPAGTPLWKEHKSKEDLLNDKRMMGEFRFKTIMQGDPQEYKDYLFDDSMFYDEDHNLTCTIPYNLVPALKLGRFWDTAGGKHKPKKNQGDYFVGILGGYDKWSGTETLYVYDMIRNKKKALKVVQTIKKAIIKDGRERFTYIQQEPGSMSSMFMEALKEEMYNYDVDYSPAINNKEYNSIELQALASEGRLKFVTFPDKSEEWIHTIIKELTNFDGEESDASKGKHDDIVDALSMMTNYFIQNRDYL